MKTLQLDIKTKVDKLMSRVSEPINESALKVYEEMLSDVKQCLHVRFDELLQSIMSLSPDLDIVLDHHEQFRQVHQSHLVTIQLHLAEAVSDTSEQSTTTYERGGNGKEQGSYI